VNAPPRQLRLPRHRVTTAHACSAYPFQVDTGIATAGVVLGLNVTAGGDPFAYDPFTAYAEGKVTNPNALVVGEPGVGKSALLKCLISRSSGLLGRWIAITDPKGEYADLAEHLGLTVIKLHPGGTQRLNPLQRDAADDDAFVRQASMVAALLASVLHRDLSPLEDAVLGWTIAALGRATREATLRDLASVLASPPQTIADRAHLSPEQLARAIEDMTYGLGKLLDRSLRGMFDGASTINLDPTGPGVVIDLSGVHHDPEALGLVMIAATSWLQSVMTMHGRPRIQVLDEAWALLSNERAARYLQACFKFGRSYGVANIAIVHRLSDLRAQADDGTALAKVTAGFLADAQTRIVFRQSADQVSEAQDALGLTETEATLLPRLARGRALWKFGAHAAVVQHVIGPGEAALCNTDARMNP
jgi:type IV secretory pathway VirB4 component